MGGHEKYHDRTRLETIFILHKYYFIDDCFSRVPRYFFKTECADLDNTVIQEEVSNDSDTLPMFDGKVMARVKAIE